MLIHASASLHSKRPKWGIYWLDRGQALKHCPKTACVSVHMTQLECLEEYKGGASEKWSEQPLIRFSISMVNVSVNIAKVLMLRAWLPPLPIKSTGIKINTNISPYDNLLSDCYIIDFSIIRAWSIQFQALYRKMGLWNWFKGTMITHYYRIKMAQGSIVLLLQYFNKWPTSNGGNAGSGIIRFPDAGDVGA